MPNKRGGSIHLDTASYVFVAKSAAFRVNRQMYLPNSVLFVGRTIRWQNLRAENHAAPTRKMRQALISHAIL